MVSIIARPTNSVREMVFGGLRLAGDGVHGGRDRAPFGQAPGRSRRSETAMAADTMLTKS